MKYIDEFRDKKLVSGLLEEIDRLSGQPVNLMEVCGTHTMAIFRSGIKQLLPETINLISGPGCPVCVTAQADIDAMLALARDKRVTIATFGDMLKVPGTRSSLEKERAAGCRVVPVYSPLDALELARERPGTEVVFLAVGFETTAPAIASVVSDARRQNITNFSIYCCHKLIPPAMKLLLDARELKLDGFLCPGHVSSIIGSRAYTGIARRYRMPCVISGFEPTDILETVLMLLRQRRGGAARVEIQYKRAVHPAGNPLAMRMLRAVFSAGDADWRGLGVIPDSGLHLKKPFHGFDAARKFRIAPVKTAAEPRQCLCGKVLRGVSTPPQCRLFGKTCTPEHPYGPCMVSSEGTCAAWYKYR
ncbi:MAG TPA: hydrogenase formation protein HypD [Candidatus Omnitrophota bacterium]|nr:hydrogenase formation protein HypD [Candidatus Omnitrophota bacterium]